MMSLKLICLRECLLLFRMRSSIVNASLFFLMIMVLFPLGFDSDPLLLKKILPGLVWIAALFVFFLSSDILFLHEYADGVLAQWLLDDVPMHVRIRVKLLVHWFAFCMPLLAFSVLIGLLFNLNLQEIFILILSLLCGTPTILSLCAFSSVFSLGVKQQGVFTALIVLPLILPVLIFGGGVMSYALQGNVVKGQLAFLLAIALLSIWVIPYAISLIIRLNVADGSR